MDLSCANFFSADDQLVHILDFVSFLSLQAQHGNSQGKYTNKCVCGCIPTAMCLGSRWQVDDCSLNPDRKPAQCSFDRLKKKSSSTLMCKLSYNLFRTILLMGLHWRRGISIYWDQLPGYSSLWRQQYSYAIFLGCL